MSLSTLYLMLGLLALFAAIRWGVHLRDKAPRARKPASAPPPPCPHDVRHPGGRVCVLCGASGLAPFARDERSDLVANLATVAKPLNTAVTYRCAGCSQLYCGEPTSIGHDSYCSGCFPNIAGRYQTADGHPLSSAPKGCDQYVVRGEIRPMYDPPNDFNHHIDEGNKNP